MGDRPISISEYRLLYELLRRMYNYKPLPEYGMVMREVAMKIADDVVR